MKAHPERQTEPEPGRPMKVTVQGVTVPIYACRNTVGVKTYLQYTLKYRDGQKYVRERFSDSFEALRRARIVAEKLSNAEHAVLRIKPEDAAELVKAKWTLTQLNSPPLSDAVADYVKARRRLPEDVTLVNVVDDWLRRNKAVRESKTVRATTVEYLTLKEKSGFSELHLHDLRTRLGMFGEAFGVTPVDSLTAPQLQLYLDNRRKAPRTIENDWRAISAMLRYAVKQKFASRDLLDEIEAVTLPKAKPTETVFFRAGELAEMLMAARKETLPFIVLGGLVGLRTREVLRLQWTDIDLAAGHVVVRSSISKTAQRRVAPLCESARQWLAPFARTEGPVVSYVREDWVAKKIVSDVTARRQAMLKEAEANGDATLAAKLSAKKPFVWKRNGLRHGFASHRLAATHDAPRTAYELGNDPRVLASHYVGLATESEGRAWFEITPRAPANVLPITKVAV